MIRIGTLESTYYAAVLANRVGSFRDIAGSRTITAVRSQVAESRAHRSVTGLLMCAVILRYAGVPEPALEEEAADLARGWLGRGIQRGDVVAARVITQLQQLGQDAPPARATLFPVRNAEDRYLAWKLLGITSHLENGTAVRRALAEQVTGLDAALAVPDDLMVKEVAAGIAAAGSQAQHDRLVATVGNWPQTVWLRRVPGALPAAAGGDPMHAGGHHAGGGRHRRGPAVQGPGLHAV